jgi:PIN domain nuclease of toxin-antitoxin system
LNLLLDTHCWLWWIAEPERLNQGVLEQIQDPGNTVYLSAASSWEIAIKVSIGKLTLPEPPERFVPKRLARDRISPLPIEHAHALRVATLPLHHRDPFDRLIVSQAQVEKLPLVTVDEQLRPYDVEIIWGSR